MSSARRPAPRTDEALLAAPLRGGAALVDRLVLALALAPRPGSGRGADSALAPAWRHRRRPPRRKG